jgi:hypothetical protein
MKLNKANRPNMYNAKNVKCVSVYTVILCSGWPTAIGKLCVDLFDLIFVGLSVVDIIV